MLKLLGIICSCVAVAACTMLFDPPDRVSANNAGPFWSIDYRGDGAEGLVTRRFDRDGDTILMQGFWNGHFQVRERWYRGVLRTRTEGEFGTIGGMTPEFDAALVDRLFPLEAGKSVTAPTRFRSTMIGGDLNGCGASLLRVERVYARTVGPLKRRVADIAFEHRLDTYNTAPSALPDPYRHGQPMEGEAHPCGAGRLVISGAEHSGVLTIDVESGVPFAISPTRSWGMPDQNERAVAFRLSRDGEIADIAAKQALTEREPNSIPAIQKMKMGD